MPTMTRTEYDYTHGAWVVNGVYVDCGHPARMDRWCQEHCYGRMHKGKRPGVLAVVR